MEENIVFDENPKQDDFLDETKEPEQSPRHRWNRPSQAIDNSGHILEVLKAAMPYVDSRNQNTMETLMKATDLIHTTRNRSEHSGELSAASLNPKAADLEGMLYSVREVGFPSERDLIDRILNFIRARKFYQTYRTMNQNRDLLQASGSSPNQYGNNNNFMEALRSILPQDQAANLDQIQTVMNAMNAMNTMNSMNNMNVMYNTNGMNNINGTNNMSSTNNTMNSMKNSNGYRFNGYTSSNSYNNAGSMNQPNMSQQNMNHSYLATSSVNSSATTDTFSNARNTSTPPWNTSNAKQNIPNYTYQMNSNTPKQDSPPTNNQPNMNQLYNNITNVYNALNAAGVTRNMNNAHSQENMMNANLSTNMRNMPIPDANAYYKDYSTKVKESNTFQPEELYQRLSDFRAANHWNIPSNELKEEVLEAASLETTS